MNTILLVCYSVALTIVVFLLHPKGRSWLVGLILFLVVMATLFGMSEQADEDYYKQQLEKNNMLMKTVAHVDLSTRDDLELVGIDTKNDVAYYTYVKPERYVNVGDTVYLFDGVGATLTSVDAVGFTFVCDNQLAAGLSGTAVLNKDGNQIGYISKRLSTGDYYAIWN